jgi:hypothetical protein
MVRHIPAQPLGNIPGFIGIAGNKSDSHGLIVPLLTYEHYYNTIYTISFIWGRTPLNTQQPTRGHSDPPVYC